MGLDLPDRSAFLYLALFFLHERVHIFALIGTLLVVPPIWCGDGHLWLHALHPGGRVFHRGHGLHPVRLALLIVNLLHRTALALVWERVEVVPAHGVAIEHPVPAVGLEVLLAEERIPSLGEVVARGGVDVVLGDSWGKKRWLG